MEDFWWGVTGLLATLGFALPLMGLVAFACTSMYEESDREGREGAVKVGVAWWVMGLAAWLVLLVLWTVGVPVF